MILEAKTLFGTSTRAKKTRMMRLPGRERSLMVSSVAGHSTGQTDTGRQQRPCLRIALRGKIWK